MPANKFRNTVEKIIDHPELYSKEDLHDLFLEMTERYLNELLSTMNYEKAIIESLGEEKGNEVIEKVATSNPDINALDYINGAETDKKIVIRNLLDYIEKEYKSKSNDGVVNKSLE